MESIGLFDAVSCAPPAHWDMWRVGSAVSREASVADGDFAGTLLARAGHDLRQPLQLSTSAHDVLAPTLING